MGDRISYPQRTSKRKTVSALITLLVASFLATGSAIAEDSSPFEMPIPEGWRTETIPFPLSFAPELDYEGIEELRFSPGMFTAGEPDFWTYSFLWWIPSTTELDAETLAADLVAYFRGLTSPPTKDGDSAEDLPIYEAELDEIDPTDSGRRRILGSVSTFDSFTTKKPVELNVRITIWPCTSNGESAHQAAYFELSPQPYQHELWGQLAEIGSAIRCE